MLSARIAEAILTRFHIWRGYILGEICQTGEKMGSGQDHLMQFSKLEIVALLGNPPNPLMVGMLSLSQDSVCVC